MGMLAKRMLVVGLGGYVAWLAFAYEYHFIDGVNLLFHEAGHVFLGLFGPTLHFLGGTLAQLFFPLACAFHFLRQQQLFEAWVVGIWFAESLMNTARYLGDAKAQALPLVGGHMHDWHWLLANHGGLDHCETIAAGLHGVAVVIALGCLAGAWLATRSEDALEPQLG